MGLFKVPKIVRKEGEQKEARAAKVYPKVQRPVLSDVEDRLTAGIEPLSALGSRKVDSPPKDPGPSPASPQCFPTRTHSAAEGDQKNEDVGKRGVFFGDQEDQKIVDWCNDREYADFFRVFEEEFKDFLANVANTSSPRRFQGDFANEQKIEMSKLLQKNGLAQEPEVVQELVEELGRRQLALREEQFTNPIAAAKGLEGEGKRETKICETLEEVVTQLPGRTRGVRR